MHYICYGRWYDPETGRYINTANLETVISNAATVYALNLYAFCISNPLAVIIAASTFMPSLDFYYDGEYKTWWEKWGNWLLLGIGIAATVIACIAAPFTCGASTPIAAIGLTLAQIALGTAVGAAVSLAIGGTIAGIQGALTGHGFWNSFGDSISENWVDAVITSFAFTAVTVAASNLVRTRCCFKEGTLVETSDGLKPIEEIEAGDEVLAYDEETGTQAYKPVVRLFRNETKVWYHIYVNGEEIICTGGHPFYVIDAAENTRIQGKWVTANELKICDKLLLSNGTCAIIQSIGIEALVEPETTYNFEVADSHTYYVSKSNVLVHNKCNLDVENTVDDALDWDSVVSNNGETRYEHVMRHGVANPNRVNHTVFSNDPIETTNRAWSMRGNITPVLERGTFVYNIPFVNAGTAGENAVRIVTIANTNKLITAYPIFI